MGFCGGSDGKASACNAGIDPGSIPGSGRSPEKGDGYPLQYPLQRSLAGYSPWDHKEFNTNE